MNNHESNGAFAQRHIGPRPKDLSVMLNALGAHSLDSFIGDVLPPSIANNADLALPTAISETEAIAKLSQKAQQNQVLTSALGMGYYDTITPAVIKRNILENPSWYTAYTPYQPEISQGRLEALLNYQTMVCDLTGMEISNSSLLDEGTAGAEAMTMSRRLSSKNEGAFFLDSDCHPQTIEVIKTRAEPLGIEIQVGNPWIDFDPTECFGILVQYPGSSGVIGDIEVVSQLARANNCLLVVAADLLSLCLLTPPGELGADLVVGSSQRFGVPLGFGGPHAGYIGAKEKHKRSMPGRLVGVSVDSAGRPATRLALQTREQHIRREKATSNICTAQVLLAVISSMYAVWHGPEGLRSIANRVHKLTSALVESLRSSEFRVLNKNYFDTITIATPGVGEKISDVLAAKGINVRLVDKNTLGISLDETTDENTVADLLSAFGCELDPAWEQENYDPGIPERHKRKTEFLTHPVFHLYRSETEMLRYIRRLADKDIALDKAMIPLGSCTMKLNATSEMEPITWPQFSNIHPFAPLDQAAGYVSIIKELEDWLLACTGYDAISLQPNAGSQGEFAGLLAIRKYHQSRGEHERQICLIPSSAHGTNAASAVMAGFRVVVVECNENGDVDLRDLIQRIDQHRDQLAAIMVTYPSTHGVFEEGIGEICDLTHQAGGQVYIDGANLNALVGLASPGHIGADISHLNLHKTFCIPHGGGGPGIGPVAAKAHLAPFLPNHPLRPEAGPNSGPGPISSAPWGSAGILPIPWMYINMMGGTGLQHATKIAILSANYLAHRLSKHYPVLYTAPNGRVAHECIIDLRGFDTIASVDDVAKRLIDYGFHAPTMSFPVPGTLMIEPTESESLVEIDRFCDAMIAIRSEIRKIEQGFWPKDDNPLINAPHPAEDLLGDHWDHAYTRAEAAYPLDELRSNKYWPPVGRIDGVFGDRNLVCSCPDPRAFEELAPDLDQSFSDKRDSVGVN